MLRGVSKSVKKPLCILVNRSFEEEVFPDIWKFANVIPIFKKGDKSQPSNYRPVALLSCIGKLQERIVFKNMYTILLDNNLLYKYQSILLIICSLALCSVMCQKHLIESDIRVFYLSYGKMALKGNF